MRVDKDSIAPLEDEPKPKPKPLNHYNNQQKKRASWEKKYGCDCDEISKNRDCDNFIAQDRINNLDKSEKCMIICCIEKKRLEIK